MDRRWNRSRYESLQLVSATIVLILTLILSGMAGCASNPTAAPSSVPLSTEANATESTTPKLVIRRSLSKPPERVWPDLVSRYRGIRPEPLEGKELFPEEIVGTIRKFWVLDIDGPKLVQIPARLRYMSNNVSWFFPHDSETAIADIRSIAKSFETSILPKLLSTFAPNLQLGGNITILHAPIKGLGGYFSALDVQPRESYRLSNERLMLVMNSDMDVTSNSYRAILAHEFQHLINWFLDPTEDTWISEGMAELAAHTISPSTLDIDRFFKNPTVSLSNWPEDPSESLTAYAASLLFSAFLAERTDINQIYRLLQEPMDGVAGINAYLNQVQAGSDFQSIFSDWLVANALDRSVETSDYFAIDKTVSITTSMSPDDLVVGEVPQLAGWYGEIGDDGVSTRIRFDGDRTTPVIPWDAYNGVSCWWSNRGDNIDTSLTVRFDSPASEKTVLHFRHWYSIEEEFDRAYVSMFDSKSRTWRILKGKRTTDSDRVGTSFGPSFTGESGGWLDEEFPIGKVVGSPALLRFNYVTDESVNAAGWCIDDIRVTDTAIDGEELNLTRWNPNGFERIDDTGIHQDFSLRLVSVSGSGDRVRNLKLDSDNDVTFDLDGTAVLIVAALTPQTSQQARFRLSSASR